MPSLPDSLGQSWDNHHEFLGDLRSVGYDRAGSNRTAAAKMNLFSKRYEVDDLQSAQEFYHSRNWTDGLPVVPPTPDAVEACLEWVMMPADHLVGVEPVRQRAITAEKVAVNAVMAGCLPMHFPVVVAAFTSMLQEPFLLHGATASTGGCAILIVINGPVRGELGMDGTFNALASSDRATTVIGRAIRLTICNLLDARPGDVDRSTLGHPGKFSYCIAEDEENSPWLPWVWLDRWVDMVVLRCSRCRLPLIYIHGFVFNDDSTGIGGN